MSDTPDPPSGAAPRSRRRGRVAAAIVAAAASLLVLPPLALWAVASSETGTRWLLGQVPGLRLDGLRGTLVGPVLAIETLQWQGTPQQGTLRIERLELRDPRWRLLPHPGAMLGLRLDAGTAERVVWRSSAEAAAPIGAPSSLRLPFALEVPALRIAALQLDERVVARELRARLRLSEHDGAEHRLDDLSADVERARVQGQSRVVADAPFDTQLELRGSATPAAETTRWEATARAVGPLAKLELQAALRGRLDTGRAPASLDAQATIEPFAAWPLAALTLATRELDLAAFSDAAPHTRLDARARVDTHGLERPVTASLQIDNRAPGRLDERRLPLAHANVELHGALSQRDRLTIEQLDATLADAQAAAGRVRGRGQWLGTTLRLQLQTQGVQPQRLDSRAGAMELSGPLTLELRGLPVPTAPREASAAAPPPWQAAVDADLDGTLGAHRQPLRTQFAATLRAGAVDLTRLRAASGEARLEGRLSLQRVDLAAPPSPAAPKPVQRNPGWQIAGNGEIARFDPLPWWPGTAGSAWSRGGHRLDARWTLDLRVPDDIGARLRRDAAAAANAVTGQARVELNDSLLAGAPLAGRVSLQADAAAVDIAADLTAAANRVEASGRWARVPSADRWQLRAAAPTLAALQPIVALLPPSWAARAQGLRGEVQAELQAEGRWPRLSTQGTLRARELRWRDASLRSADARWQLAPGDAGALQLDAALVGWQRGEQRLDAVTARAEGTRSQHRLQLQLDTPLRPPAWTESLLGPTAGGMRVTLDGDGAWQRDEGAGGGTWRAQQATLRVASRPTATQSSEPRAASAAPPSQARVSSDAAWIEARELRGLVAFAADGALRRAELAPGRATVAGGVALRWSEAAWGADGGGGDRIDLRAELEPLAMAPLLARAQPDIGWTGDLRLGGRIELRAGERFDADVVLERVGGDLRIADETGTQQPLGFTDLRLVLSAHDGRWQFAQGAAGRQLGEMAGSQVMRIDPRARWPAPDAPLEGVMEVRVANLGAWGVWVPPGWRLGGQLQVSGELGGRVGAPELRGSLRGSGLSARNALQGIGVADGELTATLDGSVARVQRFEFKGGDGVLRVSGGATLGETPSAQLQLEAERFRLLGRIDRRLVASGRATLALSRESLRVDGRFVVDEGLVDFSRGDAPALDGDVQVVRAAANGNGTSVGGGAPAAGPARALPAALRDAQIRLAVDLGERLQVRGRGLDTGLRGELTLSTPGGRTAVHGSVRTVSGTYVAYAQKMTIERGELAFSGPAENPRLDIIAIRPNLDVRVGVAVTGTLANPRVRLFSEPEMSEMDKLSWLVLGRPSDGLGRTDTALLQRAAIALLAGEGEGPTDQLLNQLGLSDFSVRQSEGEVKETIVSLGRQLSQRWYVGYERSVNATTGTWQLIYRIAQRLTVRAQSGVENSLDVIWSWRWN